MYKDTVTLFNRYTTKDRKIIWYPTVLRGVNLNVDKASIVAKYGGNSQDNAVLNVLNEWLERVYRSTEITHVLEGSDLYAELQGAVKAYATTKGEYKSKLEAIAKLYEGVEGANVEQELTADLISEYLFTDEAFVQQLSAQNRNIFQKIYDEIKYLCKVVSPGSKEAKQLEKVKRAFEKAYKENNSNTTDSNTLFSISETSKGEGREIIKIIEDNLDKIKKDNVFSAKYDATVETYNKKSDYVLEIFEKQGNKAHNDKIGVVELVKSDAKSTISHGFGKDKLASVSAIKDVIENGRIIHSSLDHKGSGVDRYIIAARGMIDDKPACIGVVVKSYPKTKGDAKFYLHEAKIIETNKADLSSMTAPQLSVDTVDKPASNNIISKDTKNTTENPKFSLSETTNKLKQKQLDIVLQTNPAGNSYSTWIRSIDDILAFEEALNSDDYIDYKGDDFDPSYPYSIAEQALETGRITVYSSYPIKQGVFVSPSIMEAQMYSGNGQVYSKEVELTDVAWIDPTQGQYANTNEKYSLSNDDIAPTTGWNIKGSDITLDDSTPIRKDIAPAQNQETSEEWSPYEPKLTEDPFTLNEWLERVYRSTQFARGSVLLDIGGNQYSASVIVGYKENGEMIFYDLQDLNPASFKYKKRYNQNQSDKTETGKTTASPTLSISEKQKNTTENQKLSLGDDIALAGKWNVKGSDITLDDSTPIRKDIAPAQNQETSEEWSPYEPKLTEDPFLERMARKGVSFNST